MKRVSSAAAAAACGSFRLPFFQKAAFIVVLVVGIEGADASSHNSMDQFASQELREGAQKEFHQLDQDALQHNLEGILGRDRNLWRDKVADGAVE